MYKTESSFGLQSIYGRGRPQRPKVGDVPAEAQEGSEVVPNYLKGY